MLDRILPAIIAQPLQAASSPTKGGAVASSSTQRIEPPVGAGDLAEATARVSPDQLKEAAPLPAVSVEAASATADVTLRELAPWLRRLAQWLLALLALYAVGWLLVSAAPALTP